MKWVKVTFKLNLSISTYHGRLLGLSQFNSQSAFPIKECVINNSEPLEIHGKSTLSSKKIARKTCSFFIADAEIKQA